MKLATVRFPSAPCHFFPMRSKNSRQHYLLEDSLCPLVKINVSNLTPIQNSRWRPMLGFFYEGQTLYGDYFRRLASNRY
jgi:hypothetical protein